jgi:hypothetical protein
VFKLYVVGGSGTYEWASEDLDVAIVSQEGLIKSKKKGKTVTIKNLNSYFKNFIFSVG